MKKLLCVLMAAVLLFAAAGCAELEKELNTELSSVDDIAQEIAELVKDAENETEPAEPAQSEQPGQEERRSEPETESNPGEEEHLIDESGIYDSKEEVALYIKTYGKLPSNYITKDEARSLGWNGGTLEDDAPGKCIGGTYFGNFEGLLPEKDGRTYYECDIDTLGKTGRGAERIVYSDDGLIYYTDDHYETFELLYGNE